MILYQSSNPYSDSVMHPNCSECGALTQLFGIELERPGYELLSFVCSNCEHIETAIGKVA
jgi:hypothetical protein